jgi:hypothetical protein
MSAIAVANRFITISSSEPDITIREGMNGQYIQDLLRPAQVMSGLMVIGMSAMDNTSGEKDAGAAQK